MIGTRRLASGLAILLSTLGAAGPAAAQAKPEGEMRWALYVTVPNAVYGNASSRMSETVPGDGAYAYGSWPDVDQLYKQQARETDKKKREVMLRQIQQILHERARFAPMFDYIWPSAVGPRVEDPALMLINPYPWSAPYEEVKLKKK